MRTTIGSSCIGALGVLLVVAACSNGHTLSPADTTGSSAGLVSADTAALHARMVQLESDARALAKTEGCSAAAQCRTAPVGDRPCGGPRTYVPYCSATTDSAALFRKLDELVVTEKRYNALVGLASTCEFRLPPGVEVSGGSCRATAGTGNRVP